MKEQLRDTRAAQHELETDLRNKESAMGIDTLCHQLNNSSRGIQYYAGVERFNPNVSVPQSWADGSSNIVKRSQTERAHAAQIRTGNQINPLTL